MNILILDLETTVQPIEGHYRKDNSPYHPENRIVSAQYLRVIDKAPVGSVETDFYYHNDLDAPASPEGLQSALDWADRVVAHNAKFDLSWLLEAGFTVPEDVYCTMVAEYVFQRAVRESLSLKNLAIQYDVTRKKSDLVDQMFKEGTGFEKMPMEVVQEYGEADVVACWEIYQHQQARLKTTKDGGLAPTIQLMMEMLLFITEIERNGINIDMDALLEVEEQFLTEKKQIIESLNRTVREVMGDTPINLNSGADMNRVIYSREVVDRDLHIETFNLGTGPNGKPKYAPKMTPAQFTRAVRKTTRTVRKTIAKECQRCDGSGYIRKTKKDGMPYKGLNRCPTCDTAGATYEPQTTFAGFRLVPENASDASVHGFKTDKKTIKRLIAQAEEKENPVAAQFLKNISRLNAVNTYLDSFVAGIKRYTRPNGTLHANFNQTTTRTGRLSSSDPNFQNQPKGGKFPVRRAVTSRFEGGYIMEADFSGLEFRVAGLLSGDEQIISDILSGKDVHKQTASIVQRKPVQEITKEERQNAKAYTFAPLYGGMGASEPPHVRRYFEKYFEIYKGLAKWHDRLKDGVLKNGIVRIPSGREYAFPNTVRRRNGSVSNGTAIVNYPVQGFATGDIVPLACIRAYKAFKQAELQSKLILTVHDSIVIDAHPDELGLVARLVAEAMDVSQELVERFDFKPSVPLDIEIEAGPNWMQMSELGVDQVAA